MWVIASGNLHLPLKLAVVDLHGNDSDRLARRRKRHLQLPQWFRRFAVSPDPEPSQPYFNFDLIRLNAGHFDADSKAGSALKDIDRRTPLHAGIMKIREMDLGDLIGHLADLALKKA